MTKADECRVKNKPRLSALLEVAIDSQWKLPPVDPSEDVAPYQAIVDCMRKGEFEQAWRKARIIDPELCAPGAVDTMLLRFCSDLVQQYWNHDSQCAFGLIYCQIIRGLAEHGC